MFSPQALCAIFNLCDKIPSLLPPLLIVKLQIVVALTINHGLEHFNVWV